MPAVEFSLQDFARKLGVAVDGLQSIDWRPALTVCALLIQNDTRERFRRFEDPDGRKWAPLKHKPKIPKGRTVDQPLWATGRLVASTAAGAPDHVEQLSRNQLVYGTNVQYGKYHQFGTKHMVARPFLGVGDDLREKIEDVLIDYAVDELVKGLTGSAASWSTGADWIGAG